MALSEEEIQWLDARAQEVGRKVGWNLRFLPAPNPEFVGVIAGPDNVFIMEGALSDLAAHDIELDLDALERGDREIIADEDGDPRLI